MYRIALIALGGGAGSVLRYLVQGWVQRLTKGTFPLGTLVVNVSGCLVIGVLAGLFLGARPLLRDEDYRIALMMGVLGGYTTFSAFSLETMNLVGEGDLLRASVNVLASVGAGLAATWLGRALALAVYRP